MSHDHLAHAAAEATVGAIAELAKRGGTDLGLHPHGIQQAGELAVRGAAAAAPSAVAMAARGTAAVAAGTASVLSAAAPVLVLAAAGYAAYKIYKWVRN